MAFANFNQVGWFVLFHILSSFVTAQQPGSTKVGDEVGDVSGCIANGNEAQPFCRFNADCCSGLCTTFDAPNLPKCVENIASNHISDSYAPSPTVPDFKPTRYEGMERWRDKVAVVTGAASGMGFAITKRLCNEGMIVVGLDINKDGVEKVADQCPTNSYYSFAADLTREEDIVNAFRYVDDTLGRVDVLANNAGVARMFPLMDASSEGLRTMFDLNVLAPVLCTREALKIMLARNITDGYIFFTNSVAGGRVQQDVFQPRGVPLPIHAYEATKHALMVIREGLRQELRNKGLKIRVGEVAPGAVITNIAESFVPRDDTDEAGIKRIFSTISAVLKQVDRISPDESSRGVCFHATSSDKNGY